MCSILCGTPTLYFFNSHNIRSKYNYFVFNLLIFHPTSHQCSNSDGQRQVHTRNCVCRSLFVHVRGVCLSYHITTCCIMTKNWIWKNVHYRDTIMKPWYGFWGRLGCCYWTKIVTWFVDKICVPWVVRKESWHDLENRDTILTVLGHYLSISVNFWVELQERETWEIKGGNFRVAGLWLELFWEVLLSWETL